MPNRFLRFLINPPNPPLAKWVRLETEGGEGIFKRFRSVKEFCRALIFNNLAKEISGLRDLIRNKNRKGLSIILAMVEISFKFHKGIHFDNLDDLFDKNFLPQIPPSPPLLKGG